MSVPALRVRHLWQRLGSQDVLRDLSFEVGEGEIFGFIGPNGAGKTTTIRVLTTLLPPTSGRVEVCGIDVAIDPQKVRKLIGYMPDHAGVYANVTVREYLEFFADAHDVSRDGYASVDAAIELTGLGALEGKLVAAMSKGMKQRLQLARVLLHDPKVLILDEPASDLDPRARIEMRDLILELARLKKTIFLSSHILTELADICHSVAILERGQLMAAGPVARIGEMLSAQGAQTAAQQQQLHGVRLRLRATLHDALQAVREHAQVVRAEGVALGSGELVQVTAAYHGDERLIEQLVATLVQRGYGVLGVEPERNELERIFMQVTRGEMQ